MWRLLLSAWLTSPRSRCVHRSVWPSHSVYFTLKLNTKVCAQPVIFTVFILLQMFGTVSIAAAGYRFVAPYIDVCRDYYNSELCTAALNLIFFGPSMFITPDETAVIFKTWPASVSMRNVGHWAQMLTDGQLRFQVRPSSM